MRTIRFISGQIEPVFQRQRQKNPSIKMSTTARYTGIYSKLLNFSQLKDKLSSSVAWKYLEAVIEKHVGSNLEEEKGTL